MSKETKHDGDEKNAPAVVDKTKSLTAPEPKHGASTPAKRATEVRPIVGGVDVHKMANEGDPTFDYTRERKKEGQGSVEERAAKEEAENKEVESSFKDASDDVLAKCVFEDHEAVETHDERDERKSMKAKGKSAPKGAISVGSSTFGAISIPWATIWAMLKALGLPTVKPALVRLRSRLVGTSWPSWIKNPLIAAIDAILADDNLFSEFQRRVDV